MSQTVLGRVHNGGGSAANLEGPKVTWHVGPQGEGELVGCRGGVMRPASQLSKNLFQNQYKELSI